MLTAPDGPSTEDFVSTTAFAAVGVALHECELRMPGRIAARARVLYPLTYVYLLAFVITMVCTTWTAALMPKTLTKRPVVLSMALASAWTFADFLGNLCGTPHQVELLARVFAPIWAFLPLVILTLAVLYTRSTWPPKNSWWVRLAAAVPGIASIVLVETGALYSSFHDPSENGVYFWSETTAWQWLINVYFLTYLAMATQMVRKSGQEKDDPILRRTGHLMFGVTFFGLIGGGVATASATGVEPPFLGSIGVALIVVIATRGIFKHRFFTSVEAMRVERDQAMHALMRREEVLGSLSLGVAIARPSSAGTLDLVYQNVFFDRFFEGASPLTLTSIFLPAGAKAPRLFREVEHNGRQLSVQSYEILYDSELAFLFSVDDLSEKKWLEAELAQKHAQLLQAQKMEAVGQLAAGITHDFNNQLQSISLLTELMVRLPNASADIKELAGEIVAAVRRARSLTQQLLRFGRKQVQSPEVVDVVEAIGSLERLLGYLLGSEVKVQLHFPTAAATITIDRVQFEQVLMTLATNARDAMADGGTFEISVEVLDEQVAIRISDTGHGMTPEIITRVFEPFFTTKGQGGTGLGLAVTQRIVEQAGGSISVESAPGEQTAFTLRFPLTLTTITVLESEEPPHRGELEARFEGTILVVDDQVPLLRGLVRVLQAEGFRVLGATSGKEALALFETEKVHVLLTDLTMPEMGGVQLAQLLLQRHPDLCVLYMTGYNPMTRVLRDKGEAVLTKPFDQDVLVAEIEKQRAKVKPRS